MNAQAHEWNVNRLVNKIRLHRDEIIRYEEKDVEDAEVVVVSFGISARTALWPIEQARREGIRVGYLRLITVWPFPEARIRQLAKGVRAFVVPEINLGQIVREVERAAAGQAQVFGAHRAGGDILEPHFVLNVIRQAAGRPVQQGENAAHAASEPVPAEE
jgi:2-oxoglutarate ferredoxin oxidoreductase subunit alpha